LGADACWPLTSPSSSELSEIQDISPGNQVPAGGPVCPGTPGYREGRGLKVPGKCPPGSGGRRAAAWRLASINSPGKVRGPAGAVAKQDGGRASAPLVMVQREDALGQGVVLPAKGKAGSGPGCRPRRPPG
jgi:hypothetical protein